ncbi:MurT ligase domain-containing protein [Adlercreutzia sp. ZJ141]|uniref:MurT ligase domain-containing protein n=1 Tax=Adlercreutzia sp. ZJ141 TaxID=2709406 RepID=UPI0013EDD75F|nr:MurT ligase domain-containing protein [Adlercreutzia sp. ZJ141]
MSFRFACARAVSAASTWALKNVFHRPAANFPGQIALRADPDVIAHLAPKLTRGSICVVGTNGKTTTTNLLADALEVAGQHVVCNRTGANLDSGIASALLHASEANWGVLECDEMWLAKVLPHLKSDYVLLLNLFRDQLDRMGEIARVQDSIAGALESSPNTVLLYNADDPLCAAIAARISNKSLAFGIAESMGLSQNTVSDTNMCQQCSAMMTYDFRQYGQLGAYRCPECGFARPTLDFAADNVQLAANGLAFDIAAYAGANATAVALANHSKRCGEIGESQEVKPVESPSRMRIEAPFSGSYMVYNLLACAVGACVLGCPPDALKQAIESFDPKNGRLQTYQLNGRRVLLNLAKNPTGFNQNLKIVAQDKGQKAVAFFINDKEADGHDVSWLWDIDFEELAESGTTAVYASGIRGNDMQVRLKYANIESRVAADADEVLNLIEQLPPHVNAYLIANYTALPGAKAALDRRANEQPACGNHPGTQGDASLASSPFAETNAIDARDTDNTPLVVIAHLFPDLLNLYGDGGNVRILEQRLRWRGIPCEIRRVQYGENVDLSSVDLVFMGGGPDREQKLASNELMRMRENLRTYVEEGGALLAICGGYQILGSEWLWGDDIVEGLGLVDITTRRPGTSANRLIDNIVLESTIATHPVVGYENHAGRTYLGEGVQPFGKTVSSVGCGNNDETRADGILYRNVLGTYLHGPLLAKNPEVADWLLDKALLRASARGGCSVPSLSALDDSAELAANAAMRHKLGVRS